MIYITLGTQNFKMDRLIDEIDRLIEINFLKADEVVIQNGFSKQSKYAKCYKLIPQEDFNNIMKQATLIICHGGTSSIIKGLSLNKKVIAIPRNPSLNEHVDNHQYEIVNTFVEKEHILTTDDLSMLRKKIIESQNFQPKSYEKKSNLSQYLFETIIKYLNEGKK